MSASFSQSNLVEKTLFLCFPLWCSHYCNRSNPYKGSKYRKLGSLHDICTWNTKNTQFCGNNCPRDCVFGQCSMCKSSTVLSWWQLIAKIQHTITVFSAERDCHSQTHHFSWCSSNNPWPVYYPNRHSFHITQLFLCLQCPSQSTDLVSVCMSLHNIIAVLNSNADPQPAIVFYQLRVLARLSYEQPM